MLSEKEKLEEELRFLKESYDIGVITDEEYENGRQRVQAKIKHIEEKENDGDGLFKDIARPEEIRQPADEYPGKKDDELKIGSEEQEPQEYPMLIPAEKKSKKRARPAPLKKKKEEPAEAEEPKESEETEEEHKEELKEEEWKELGQEEKDEEPENKEEDIFPLDTEDRKETGKKIEAWKAEKYPQDSGDEIKFGKKTLVFAAVFIIAAFGIWYLFFTGNSDNANMPNGADVMASNAAALIACHSDNDCTEKGKIGSCANPGKEDAECSFIDDIEVKLSIINSKECFNCDTDRIISILESFYPNLGIEEIDYDAAEGKALANRFNINALPAYILNSSLSEAHNYEKFSNAFSKVGDNFVMKNNVANANYYIGREEIPNRLDMLVQQNQEASNKAEANLQEFLAAFGGKVTFSKHNSDSALAKELGLNSFPAFLINNKNKFGGVQAADTIKENFCQLNKLEECSLELSKSLV